MQGSTYQKEILVDGAHSDFALNMTCSGMLRHAQLIASEHCAAVGYGDAYMASVERVFLLTRIKIDIITPPKRAELIDVVTTAYAPDRILYPRITRFFSKSGEELVRIDSRWVLVDTVRFRIVRKAPDSMNFPFAPEPPADFRLPERRKAPISQSLQVRYSMVDSNHHLNNAVYADIVMDALEDRLFCGETVRQFMIAYHREAKPGAQIDLGAVSEGDSSYVTGMLGADMMCFEAFAAFYPPTEPLA